MTPSLRRFWLGFRGLAFGTLVASLLVPALAAAQNPAVKARTAPTTKAHALIANWIFATLPSKAPIPLSIQNSVGRIVLSWGNPSFVLQSATNVSGPFAAVPSATSPYTNNVTPSRLFFRLQAP